MDPQTLFSALRREALRLGFDLAGTTSADPPEDLPRLDQWLERGHAGSMSYFADRREAYGDLNRLLEGVRSVFMLGINYRTVEPIAAEAGQGRVARYAWGTDYHDLLHDRLRQLVAFHERIVPGSRARGVVDTAPLLERHFAHRAGLGQIGKNTTLLHRKFGSWILLAAILSTEILEGTVEEDEPFDPCGNCRACLEACPTGALVAPYQIDARRCLSYLTIEHRGELPDSLRPAVGHRFFGCDTCQEACPWNRETPSTTEPAFAPREGMNPVDLAEIRRLDEAGFRRRFRGTPLWRAKLSGLLRNAEVILEGETSEPKPTDPPFTSSSSQENEMI